jgi:purine-binding chemotaxis protein CheW
MSGKDLIDDYLSELMDDPGKGKPSAPVTGPAPAAAEPAAAPADAPASDTGHTTPADGDRTAADLVADVTDAAPVEHIVAADDMPPAPTATEPATDPLAAFRDGTPTIGDDEFEAMLDAMQGKPAAPASPAADPLDAFRGGPATISDDEFEAMLDALEGKPAAAAPAPAAVPAEPAEPAAPTGDPLAEFRTGDPTISDDEFEAMLDALQGAPPAVAPAVPSPVASAAPVRAAAPASNPAIEALLPPRSPAPAPLPVAAESALAPERRRRADDRITSWLRFSLARQHFAVEVLKVQEVLRVPLILPVRGTAEAMLGVMNLRGQIVPVMDLAVKLGFSPTEANDASRVIVLEENGETLGLLVAAVADVVNLSDGKMERISGTPSLVAAEVVRGISRRDGLIVIMLDATRLLA